MIGHERSPRAISKLPGTARHAARFDQSKAA
jgi:hypothetical protein